MPTALIRKLELFAPLHESDKRLLEDATCEVKALGPHQDIIVEGDKPDHVHLILEGWAARYKLLADGGRPIMAYLIPGDLCDIHVTLLDQMDHSITTLSACRVAYIPRQAMNDLLQQHGRLARALWWSTLVDEAILREWLVTVGHRPADQHLAHFVCEMLFRLKAVALTDDDSFEMPITQEELGDSMGMSTVHVNRMMQELRGAGLITTRHKQVIVNDLPRLMEFAGFNPNYLHHQQKAGSVTPIAIARGA